MEWIRSATLSALSVSITAGLRTPCPRRSVAADRPRLHQAGIGPGGTKAVALRARFIDRWAGEFLDARPGATVLHLGCGLDTRVHRMDPPPSVRWYDVDYPEVIELRGRLFPGRAGCATIGSSVTDLAWLERVPGDAPALVVAEGLLYYLDPTGGAAACRSRTASRPGSSAPCRR
ncbi:class I SAM-dependent methyltransferase [Nonomuraea sp. NPDC049709]|uniref:class I SAM-dependent methyltransferase n=1 Tax=Nonomuraea sp. NPDC049709 TaxID=3154736 RepID=UPI00342CB771